MQEFICLSPDIIPQGLSLRQRAQLSIPSPASLQNGIWDVGGGGSVVCVLWQRDGPVTLILPGVHWFTSGLAPSMGF